MKTLRELQQELEDKQTLATLIAGKPEGEITDEDIAAGEKLPGEIKAIVAEIERYQAARKAVTASVASTKALRETQTTSVAYPTAADAAARNAAAQAAETRVDNSESEADKFLLRGPFKSFGEMAYHTRRCGSPQPGFWREGKLGEWNTGIGKFDDAIKAMSVDVKAATGMNELADSEGAALIPLEFATGIWKRTQGEENLLTRIGTTPVNGNGLRIIAWQDKDRTSDTLFGGARAYWQAEASQGTNTKPTTRNIELRLNKLMVLMPATDELLDDAPALESELTTIAGACFVYKINKSIINGGGVGEPLGLLNSKAKITAAAKSGQGANTIIAQNIDDMFRRRSPGSSANLIWLYTIDAEAQLGSLSYGTGTYSGQLVNMPPSVGGFSGIQSPQTATLRGRPMLEMEQCQTLGTEGDLILWDPTSHIAIVKTSGVNQAVSMHLRFDYDETVFRFTFRMDARSRWENPLTPAVSSTTRSPIVTLNSTRT